MKKFVICDDSAYVMDDLKDKITEICAQQTEVVTFQKAEDFFVWMKEFGMEVTGVFLDIEIGKSNGIAVAKKIEQISKAIPIVFITGHLEYVQDIFEIRPVSLLLKPIDTERLKAALTRCQEVMEETKKNIVTFQIKGVLHHLDCRNVSYVESDKRLLFIYEKEHEYKVYMKLDELEEMKLPGFLRCHKSYMVNMNYIKYLSADGIILKSGKKIPVSRSRYQESKEAFMRYFRI